MPFIETNDHTQLFYADGGTGKPVVFVASAWLSSRMWEFQIPHLVAGGLRCVAYDRRGHGRSDWPWNGYDYDKLADDLAALLDRLDLRDVTLVAHSMGGGEVVRYLTRHGVNRVERIALVIIEFPTLAQARDWYDSPEYRAILPLRTRHTESDTILIEGVEPDHDSATMAAELRAAGWVPAF